MYLYRAVATDPSGQNRKLKSWGTAAQFDNGPLLTVPELIRVSLAADSVGPMAVVTRHSPGDACWLHDQGTIQPICQTPGAGHALIWRAGEDFFCYAQETLTSGVNVYDRSNTIIRNYPLPYAAEGLAYIKPDGTPVMGNDPSLNGTIGPAQFWGMIPCQGDTAGQCDGGDTPAGSIGLAMNNGPLRMAQIGNIQTLVSIAVSAAGEPWVAANGEDTPEPDAMPWQPYQKYQPPVIVPDLPEIAIGPQRAIWRGSLSGVVRGNLGNEPDSVNLLEDSRYVSPEQEARLQALYLDRHGDLNQTAEMAKRNRVPVVLDPDGDDATAATMRGALQSQSIRVIDAKQQYPAPGEAPEAYIARVETQLVPCVIRPLYLAGGLWDEAQIAHCNLELDKLIARSPQVIIDMGFGLDRPPRSKWCADYFAKLCQATPWPTVPLRQRPPVVEPPITPPVEPPPTLGQWAKLIIAIRKLFGRRNR